MIPMMVRKSDFELLFTTLNLLRQRWQGTTECCNAFPSQMLYMTMTTGKKSLGICGKKRVGLLSVRILTKKVWFVNSWIHLTSLFKCLCSESLKTLRKLTCKLSHFT